MAAAQITSLNKLFSNTQPMGELGEGRVEAMVTYGIWYCLPQTSLAPNLGRSRHLVPKGLWVC